MAKSGEVLADGAYRGTMSSNLPPTIRPAAQTPTFDASLQAVITGMSFKQSDLTNLIYQRIGQTLDHKQNAGPKQARRTQFYTVKNLDLNNGLAVLNVHFEGQAVYNVDLAKYCPRA